MRESELLKAVKDYLGFHKEIIWERVNAGSYQTEKGFIKGASAGCPDFLLGFRGRFIGIECKTGNNKQSQSQKEWQKKCERAGCEYWVVKDLVELMDELKSLNL